VRRHSEVVRASAANCRAIVPKHIPHVPVPRPQPNIATLPGLVTSAVVPNSHASLVLRCMAGDAAKENEGLSGTHVKDGSTSDYAPRSAAAVPMPIRIAPRPAAPIPLPITIAPATATPTSATDSAGHRGIKRSAATSTNDSDRPSKRQRRPLIDITAINNDRRLSNRRVIKPTEKLREQ
jgi:hypothetical protein